MDDYVASINHVVVKGHATERAFCAGIRNSADQLSKSSFSSVGSLDGLTAFSVIICQIGFFPIESLRHDLPTILMRNHESYKMSEPNLSCTNQTSIVS